VTIPRRRVLREQIKDLLVQQIIRGELAPGQRVVESRIARELGTSQAPVREALRDVELLGLIESEPFRSARVREFGENELLDIYPVRAALEQLAVRHGFRRLQAERSTLEDALTGMQQAALIDDRAAFARHDIDFHRRLVDSADNATLLHCWTALAVEARITLTIYRGVHDIAAAAEEHAPIVEAVRAATPAAAARETRTHIENSARLARRGRPASPSV
jgi:DNA-binding GntR family transcriptional regulator